MHATVRTVERVPVAQFVARARPAATRSSSGGDHGASARTRRQRDPTVSVFVSNPAYEGHSRYEDPAFTTPRMPMAGTLTSAIGSATGILRSSRRIESASLLAPASSNAAASQPAVATPSSSARNPTDDDGGYMDVEVTASPPSRRVSDVSLITDTGIGPTRQDSDVSLITDIGNAHGSPAPRRASVSRQLLQTSRL